MKLSKAAIQDLENLVSRNPNVVGYSSTTKNKLLRGGKVARAIRVYVERKLPKAQANPKLRIPRTIQGLRVDAAVLGKITLTESAAASKMISKGAPGHIGKSTPLAGGISACNAKIPKCGTLGYFLRDDSTPPAPQKPQWYILSNAHVLDVKGSAGETLQPSPKDKGKYPHDLVGKLAVAVYQPVDAAIATIDFGAAAVITGGVPSPTANKVVKDSMLKMPGNKDPIRVQKSGRTTGVTSGRIIDGNAHLRGLKYPGGAKRNFDDLLLIEAEDPAEDFQLGGDSGSLLVDPDDQTALGLMFASPGSEPGDGALGLACRMEKVLAAFPGKIMVKPGESWP